MKGLNPDTGVMTRLKLRTAAVGLFAILAAAGTLLATTPAQAATTPQAARPLQAVTAQTSSAAATCDPKLDFEYGNLNTGALTWTNTCGINTWAFDNADDYMWAIRMPTTPYHRVWFHQYLTGNGGLSACFYSEGQDLYMENYVDTYGTWIYYPADFQVSANTSPC
jgi:hypothetical protein